VYYQTLTEDFMQMPSPFVAAIPYLALKLSFPLKEKYYQMLMWPEPEAMKQTF
jgi:hypothetical protein